MEIMVITDKYSGKFLLLVLIACFVGLWVLSFINAKLENKLPAPSLTEPIAQSHSITKSAVSENLAVVLMKTLTGKLPH